MNNDNEINREYLNYIKSLLGLAIVQTQTEPFGSISASSSIVFTTNKPKIGEIVHIPENIPFFYDGYQFSNNPNLLNNPKPIKPDNFNVLISESTVKIRNNTEYDLIFSGKDMRQRNL